MGVVLDGRKLGSRSDAAGPVLNGGSGSELIIVFPGSPHNMVDSEGLLLFLCHCPLGVPEHYLLLVLLLVEVPAVLVLELGQGDHPLLVDEVGHTPLPLLLAPIRVVDDHVQLVLAHQHAQDGLELLYLLLLVPDRVEQLLLLVLVLVLDVLQLCQVRHVFLLHLGESFAHFIYLLVEILVVLFDIQYLLLPSGLL